METTLPPQVSETPTGNQKIWAMLSHISVLASLGIIFPLIVYLAMKGDSPFAANNAREALNFHISLLIYLICCIPLVFIVVGIPLMFVIGLGCLVLAIVGTYKASKGEIYHYPLTLRLVK